MLDDVNVASGLDVVAIVVAIRASDLWHLDDLLLRGAEHHRVTDLLAIGAVWLQAVHGEASILQTSLFISWHPKVSTSMRQN
jgi:hypothetical protein